MARIIVSGKSTDHFTFKGVADDANNMLCFAPRCLSDGLNAARGADNVYGCKVVEIMMPLFTFRWRISWRLTWPLQPAN